jgi:hypothetical protein
MVTAADALTRIATAVERSQAERPPRIGGGDSCKLIGATPGSGSPRAGRIGRSRTHEFLPLVPGALRHPS